MASEERYPEPVESESVDIVEMPIQLGPNFIQAVPSSEASSTQVPGRKEEIVLNVTTRTIGSKNLAKNNTSTYPHNLSVEPSSMHDPTLPPVARAQSSYQQQPEQNKTPTTNHQQPEGSLTQGYQQSGDDKKSAPLSSQQEGPSHSSSQAAAAALTRRTEQGYMSMQQSDNPDNNQGKNKVFILHSITENNPLINALRLFVDALIYLGVNVSIDLFEQDKSNNNWSMWYEKEILTSKIVLCIITPDFYKNITEDDRIKGYAVYNLMNDSSKNIAFRAVFLDTPKDLENIPLSMRGATFYCISSVDMNIPGNEEFTKLYAFLTGQNRVEKPKLGKMIVLTPKRSKCEFCLEFKIAISIFQPTISLTMHVEQSLNLYLYSRSPKSSFDHFSMLLPFLNYRYIYFVSYY